MNPAWESFFEEAIREVLRPAQRILDVGGGLRVDGAKGNVVDPRRAWIKPLLKQVQYEVMDPVDTYHPDIVGDVMRMPMADASYDGVMCLAVLEHVPRPWDAAKEMWRVLKPGGKVFVYVPFLSPYHAMPGYYGDFFRFTQEGLEALFRDFKNIRCAPVRGPVETIIHLLPGRLSSPSLRSLGRFLDRFWKSSGKQVSGYFFLATK